MALIKCPECSNQISDQAASCPSCGYPMKKPCSGQLEFTAWRKRVLSRLAVFCGIAIPVGVFFVMRGEPYTGTYVTVLAVLGVIVSLFKIRRLPD